jgi:MtN3 and saliva related transmembrane protein
VLPVIDVLTVVVGVLMASAPLLQFQRILNRRASDDVSLGMLGLMIVGSATWLAYGVGHGLLQVIVANVVCFSASTITLLAAVRYRRFARVTARRFS